MITKHLHYDVGCDNCGNYLGSFKSIKEVVKAMKHWDWYMPTRHLFDPQLELSVACCRKCNEETKIRKN